MGNMKWTDSYFFAFGSAQQPSEVSDFIVWSFFFFFFLLWFSWNGSPPNRTSRWALWIPIWKCVLRRGKIASWLDSLLLRTLNFWGDLDVFLSMSCLEFDTTTQPSLRWMSLFQGWQMRKCKWLSCVQAPQKKSSPWPLPRSLSQSRQLSWFQFCTVSHNRTYYWGTTILLLLLLSSVLLLLIEPYLAQIKLMFYRYKRQ